MPRCAVCAFACLLAPASAFYLPGVAPRDYLPGEKVDLKVNKLTSTKTQCAKPAARMHKPIAATKKPLAVAARKVADA